MIMEAMCLMVAETTMRRFGFIRDFPKFDWQYAASSWFSQKNEHLVLDYIPGRL